MNITEEQLMDWVDANGSVEVVVGVLLDLLNGEYTPEEFKEDVIAISESIGEE